jgi:pumilio family protein 6
MKSTGAAQRAKLVEEMARKMTGHILQVTLRHDASRIVESILQFGTAAQKLKVLEELAPKLVDVAKTPYGHFVVLKVAAE